MYDLIIIGSGAGGLACAIYSAMANKKVLILEKNWLGGQTANIHQIKNYPGFSSISGYELAEKMISHAKSLGAEIKLEEVTEVLLNEDIKTVKTHKNTYNSKGVVIATGLRSRPLDAKNQSEYVGKGLSYCATCDGNFFKDKIVAVVGGGDVAMHDCIYLSGLAKKVYLIHRRDVFTAKTHLYEKVLELKNQDKVEIITNTTVENLYGENVLEAIEILNKVNGNVTKLNIDGIFVAIGSTAETELFNNQIALDEKGFVITDKNMQTNIKNVFAVGDVRVTELRQIVTACSDGAIASTTFIKNN